jgi:CubicO group peptidase (beta-lactamase class C family)
MKVREGELRLLLEQSLQRHHVPGANVAVLHDGELTTVAAGMANLAAGIEMTPDTVMHIGSITKVFNATLVMQLVDEGLIDLDQPVLKYLSDLKLQDQDALRRITVRMLLSHTSGIDGDMLPDCGPDEETIEKGIARFAQLKQLFPPGTDCSYCNAATVIAGYVVQRLRGKSWYSLIKERIFEPLDMKHAAALPEDALLHRASVGHYFDPKVHRAPVRTSFAFLPLSWAPCGTTLMMSAADLIAFARAHMALGKGLNGARIMSEHSARAMQSMIVDNRRKAYIYTDGIGLGWMVSEDGLLYHGGGGPGIGSVCYVHPGRGFAAAVLTNGDQCLSVINDVMKPWLKEIGNAQSLGETSLRRPAEPIRIHPQRYVGTYEDVIYRWSIVQAADGLTVSKQAKFAPYENISLEPTPPTRLEPLGDDQFLMHAEDEDSATMGLRILVFRNPDTSGRMRYLGTLGRLYPRVQ